VAVSYIPFRFPGVPGVRVAFQTRAENRPDNPYSGGNISYDVGDDPHAVTRARQALQQRLGFTHWLELKQVHGQNVVFDNHGNGLMEHGTLPADGQATDKPGHALVVKTADCQPIMVAHKGGRHVLGMHAGWRGNVQGLPTSGVRLFCERYGLDPADCMAVRGPSLSPPAAQFIHFETEFGEGFRDYHDPESQTVNLWRLTRDQLMAAGILEHNIFGLDLCTYSNPDRLFSYRFEKVSGRHANLIWIEKS